MLIQHRYIKAANFTMKRNTVKKPVLVYKIRGCSSWLANDLEERIRKNISEKKFVETLLAIKNLPQRKVSLFFWSNYFP